MFCLSNLADVSLAKILFFVAMKSEVDGIRTFLKDTFTPDFVLYSANSLHLVPPVLSLRSFPDAGCNLIMYIYTSCGSIYNEGGWDTPNSDGGNGKARLWLMYRRYAIVLFKFESYVCDVSY